MEPIKLTAENIDEIFNSALIDPSLISSISIDQILDSLDSAKNDYLENKTNSQISTDIAQLLNQTFNDPQKIEEYHKKLIGYRLVDELHELHKGKHVRWIRRDNGKMTNGGIVTDIRFLDNGTHILCMNSMRRFIQYKFDECITFQKLTETELLLLMAYEYANDHSST
jgi:hypothetical protein